MALTAKLQLKQTQSLVITPQLMQAIRLLQMSSLELDSFIAGEIDQNPLLERVDTEAPVAPVTEEAAPADDPAEAVGDLDAEPGDHSPEQFGSDNGRVSVAAGPGASAATWDDAGIEPSIAATESLAETLERGIASAFADNPGHAMIASVLMSELDEAGYLTVPLRSVAERLGTSSEEVETVLKRCQTVAPTGMFARTLSECLALQLAELNRLDPAMQALLQNLELLAAGDKPGLSARCGVDWTDIDEMIREIRALDPKPGLKHAPEAVRTLIPDVFVRRGAGGWTVELNDAALPRVIVDRVYCARVAAKSKEPDRRYLADCLQKASWLEKSLDQRARTVLRVACEIVRRQEGFLADGVAFLKPLNLRMVADALGIHESTVSRAAANKTIATPRGVFDFRFFFNGAISATTGEAHSAEAVKHRIRKLISEECADAILSDDAIVAQLEREGVEIARRTVAKYRELMRIGSSVERRREKRLKVAS